MNSVRLPAWFARASLVCMLLPFLLLPAGLVGQTSNSSGADRAKIPDLIATGQTSFEIPFSINSSQTNVVEVALQVSKDRGRSWQEYVRRSPTSTAFPFSCRSDQEFWFAIQTIDRDGNASPANHALKPELRIAVDTTKPQLEFNVRPDAAGRIVCIWTARDKNIDPCSMSIKYQSESASNDQWYSVPSQTCKKDVPEVWRDELAWWPQTSARSIRILATVKDLAGNIAEVKRSMSVPLTAGNIPGAGGNHLRPSVQQTAQQAIPKTIQINQRGSAGDTTNYLRSRIPAALSDQYHGTRSARKQPGKQGPANSSLRPKSTESSLNPVTPNPRFVPAGNSSSEAPPIPSSSEASVHKSVASNEPIPQPPGSQRNRFASSQPASMANHQSAQNAGAGDTSWKSSTQGSNSSNESTSTTATWKPRAGATDSRVARQPYYNESQSSERVQSAAGQNPPQQNQHDQQHANTFSGANGTNTLSANSASTTLNRSHDPMRPMAPVIPDRSRFNNSASSANGQWISSTTGASHRPAPSPSSVLASGPEMESLRKSARPSLSKRFQLEYDIDAIGPDGVKTIELWVTRDGGKSWRRLTTDPDQRSPVNVSVESEGIYGFRILVISNDGLRAKQPRSGDPADMWVNVDTTRPAIQITGVPFGRGQDAGKLLIQWRGNDANLTLRPAKLMYSQGPQGPWTTIQDGIRNEGQFAWKPSVNIPDKIYLKMEMRDQAGNVGVHQLDEPVDVSGLIPRGRIRGLTPIRELPNDLRDTET